MKKHFWTLQEENYLCRHYANEKNEDIAIAMGLSVGSVVRRAGKLSLKKSHEFFVRMSDRPEVRATRFKKGHVPTNKGLKGYHPNSNKQAIERQKKTQFTKGHIPHNHKPVGSERISRDGYLEVKVAEPRRWELKHRIVWRQHYGNIPHGYNIQFKDGNRMNVTIENLYMISRSEQLNTQNSLRAKYPKDMQEVIMLRGALKRKLNSLK